MCLDDGPTGQPRVRAFEGSPVQGAVTHHAGFWWAVEIRYGVYRLAGVIYLVARDD